MGTSTGVCVCVCVCVSPRTRHCHSPQWLQRQMQESQPCSNVCLYTQVSCLWNLLRKTQWAGGCTMKLWRSLKEASHRGPRAVGSRRAQRVDTESRFVAAWGQCLPKVGRQWLEASRLSSWCNNMSWSVLWSQVHNPVHGHQAVCFTWVHWKACDFSLNKAIIKKKMRCGYGL